MSTAAARLNVLVGYGRTIQAGRTDMAPQATPSKNGTRDGLLDFVDAAQRRHEVRTSSEERKGRGQFFTPPSIATFMSGLVRIPPRHFRVLDPGAGTGVLSAAICERIIRLRSARDVEFVLFETDANVLPALDENMRRCRARLRAAGHDMTYKIDETDFVLSNRPRSTQGTLFGDEQLCHAFDAAIMNPPYFKLNKNSAHARAFERIIHGQPNIYALFMATASMMVCPGGQLVAITPRSFCNGLYFREFRRWLFERMTLRRVHLFESRTEAFKDADVLQESVITLWGKTPQGRQSVDVSTSHGSEIDGTVRTAEFAADRIIRGIGTDFVIRIPLNSADAKIMDALEAWSKTFADQGFRISTGPVVTFRATAYLLDDVKAPGAIPLLFPHNVRPFETRWPLTKNGKPLALRACAGSEKLLLASRNYVLLRRFSAKEEHRRLTASSFLPDCGEWPPHIAIENHLNYIYFARRNLSETETLGLTALFNSALLDRYFRTLSGNTQVNATEIRAMPFPSLEEIRRIGAAVNGLKFTDRAEVERTVLGVLGINGSIVRDLVRSDM